MTSYNYLPQIPASALKQLFHQETQEEVNDFLSNYQYERLGLDRLMLILDDIKKYHTLPGSFLDIGCNNGLLPLFLGLFNNPAIGIDNSIIDSQELYSNLSFLPVPKELPVELYSMDLKEFLLQFPRKRIDYVLLLSVMHHWQTGYAMSGKNVYSVSEIHLMLEELFQRVNIAVYFEFPTDEPGFHRNWDKEFIADFLQDKLNIVFLSESVGPNGYIRHLYKGLPKGK